jgi:hypothetical protein
LRLERRVLYEVFAQLINEANRFELNVETVRGVS